MKLRTFLTPTVAAAAALAFTAPALAQNRVQGKSDTRMSLVLGPAFPWGKGGDLGQQGSERTMAASTSSSTPACR